MSPERPVVVASVPGRPGFRAGPEATCHGGRDDRQELVDAAWLYAWSHEALRPVAGSVAARVIAAG